MLVLPPIFTESSQALPHQVLTYLRAVTGAPVMTSSITLGHAIPGPCSFRFQHVLAPDGHSLQPAPELLFPSASRCTHDSSPDTAGQRKNENFSVTGFHDSTPVRIPV